MLRRVPWWPPSSWNPWGCYPSSSIFQTKKKMILVRWELRAQEREGSSLVLQVALWRWKQVGGSRKLRGWGKRYIEGRGRRVAWPLIGLKEVAPTGRQLVRRQGMAHSPQQTRGHMGPTSSSNPGPTGTLFCNSVDKINVINCIHQGVGWVYTFVLLNNEAGPSRFPHLVINLFSQPCHMRTNEESPTYTTPWRVHAI